VKAGCSSRTKSEASRIDSRVSRGYDTVGVGRWAPSVTLKLGAPENNVLSCVSLRGSTFSTSTGSGAGVGVGIGALFVSAAGCCSSGMELGRSGVGSVLVVGWVGF
jgi:hypothetical protein